MYFFYINKKLIYIIVMKSGYLYCYTPLCEIEVMCIDVDYDIKNIVNKDDIIYLKKIINPKIVKKKIYKKFKNYLLINNIFSIEKKQELLNYIKKF